MPKLNLLLKKIVKFLSISLHNIFLVIVVAVIGIPTLVSWATGTLDILIQTIKLPTPLWATIALAFLSGVYIYLKCQKSDPSNPPKKKNYIIKYFTIDNYKWETKIFDTGNFVVDEYPFCPIHDLRFIPDGYDKRCPGPEKGSCNNRLRGPNTLTTYETAKSIIENKVKNKKY